MKKIVLKSKHIEKLDSISQSDYIDGYLRGIGVSEEDLRAYRGQIKDSDYESPYHLDNIEKAAEITYDVANAGKKIFVQVDSDCDGYTSSSILCSYLKRRFPNVNVVWRLQEGKQHGVIVNTVPEDTALVIIPDAGSNQFEEHKQLTDKGMTVICLDHHELSTDLTLADSPAIIVNNQTSSRYENKMLSGAGVVLKFITVIDDKYFDDAIWQEYLDLAAVGIIGDAMNMRNLDNNYIALRGLCHEGLHSQFLKTLAVKQQRGIKDTDNLTKSDVAWYITPVINGVVRSGTQEDKEAVFTAMMNNNDESYYEHEWRGTISYETLYERAIRLASNAKSRQDAGKRKAFEWVCAKVRNEGLDKNNIIIVTLDEVDSQKVSSNITGLIAMELVKEFNKPVLMLRDTTFNGQHCFGGSGRNGQFVNLPSLKDELNKTHIMYAEGHGNAFGAFVLPEQVETITKWFNENVDGEQFNDKIYEVDYWFHTGEVYNQAMLMAFAQAETMYGNGIPTPLFAFELNVNPSDIMIMGKEKTAMKIRYGGVDFVMFKAADEIRQLTQSPKSHIQIVGRPTLNNFNGRTSIQVMIEDLDIQEQEEAGEIDFASLLDDLI